MKRTSLFIMLFALLGLSVACDREVEREEFSTEQMREDAGEGMEEMEEESSEFGENVEDAGEEIVE
ncbi:MAG: hypothetical protein ACLGHN_16250 [Bacteriovoracia bacterium]